MADLHGYGASVFRGRKYGDSGWYVYNDGLTRGQAIERFQEALNLPFDQVDPQLVCMRWSTGPRTLVETQGAFEAWWIQCGPHHPDAVSFWSVQGQME